ncbi:MAG TPA: NAD-dependent epimerase/dehydratase family protein [Clostridiales bacterium]|nr:NAD-dependent epimerase/dehydratase family protein [Clostridiales bacterium]
MQRIREKELYQRQIRRLADSVLDWELLRDKIILITGATGMIGVFLIDVLMQRNKEFNGNIKIIAIGGNLEKAKERLGIYWSDSKFTFILHDVNEPYSQEMRNIDFIIHAASSTHPMQYSLDPIGTINANVLGTKNLLELASRQKACRLVFLSSVEIYGENRGDTDFFDEDYCGYINCNTLRACYTEGKRLGEALCQAYHSAKNIDVVIPRLSRTYGPSMLFTDTKAISQFIKRAVQKEDIILKSEGMQLYSYVYVADAVSAILTIMLKGENGEAYNVADIDSNITLKNLAECLAKLSGKKVVYELACEEEKKGYSIATKALLDSKKLKSIGWESMYDIHEGLRQTYEMLL